MAARTITVKENILGANAEQAEINRKRLDGHHVRMINIMSSPGSGKTSLIMQTIHRFRNKYRIAVIEGDVASSIDADKITQQNIPAIQINTSGGCHLDARMVQTALDGLDLDRIDLIFLENVGNLVCTADFDLGAHKDVVILSVPEGDDKPHKYPVAFIEADAVLVNKIDVLPYFDFNSDTFPEIISGLNPSARLFSLSAKTGEGMERWFSWIEETLS
ncbi:MAG TPA: hydrogenase nickel incorporation protein HypB [Acidobacteriota bacterium]|nr:hydrogenase nickel incorporation protein HypB [Acidobacteriota bacterium]